MWLRWCSGVMVLGEGRGVVLLITDAWYWFRYSDMLALCLIIAICENVIGWVDVGTFRFYVAGGLPSLLIQYGEYAFLMRCMKILTSALDNMEFFVNN